VAGGNFRVTARATGLILGIDPGSRITGYGIIESRSNSHRHITSGQIRVSGDELADRLLCIYTEIARIISEFQPAEVAVESVFMSRNPDSALKLGHARGAAMVAASSKGLAVFEYSPTNIKKAIVGKGHASKEQVQHMVRLLIGVSELAGADAADALAVAVCHSHMRESLKRIPQARGVLGGRLV